MFCSRCNNPLEESATFCGACGALMTPRLNGATMAEAPDPVVHGSPAVLAPTLYVAPQASRQQKGSTVVDPERELHNEQLASNRRNGAGLRPHNTLPDVPGKKRKRTSRSFVFLAIVAIVVLAIGGISWFLVMKMPFATASTPKGQVSFLNSPNDATGTTDALKITTTSLPNPPDGSVYDAWLIDTAKEGILPLGSLSRSDSTTFALSYPNASTQSQVNLIGAGNEIEITQEQGDVTEPGGKVMLSATFPPFAFIHIRHLLFQFPTTPGNIGLLPGLLRETQKVSFLSQLLQSNVVMSNPASVTCLAQVLVNIVEGQNGANFSSLTNDCTGLVGNTEIGDGFGILGQGGYLTMAATHAALAASQSDTTDTINARAKDVETSTTSVNAVITQINTDALQLVSSPSQVTSLVPQLIALSDRAYHGFDQNGDGRIEPVVGEAGAVTAYTSGQLMATLTLS